jgi:hypothetical protein
VAVAATMVQPGRCRACRLDLDPRAEKCWFCSTPVPAAPIEAGRPAAAPVQEDDTILFARGVLLGVAVVLVPFVIRLTALALAG